MKIALTGTHSTGKTTLFEKMPTLKEFKDFEFVREPVREFLNNPNFKINKEGDETSQLIILNEEFKGLILGNENSIYDRTILDAYAYNYYNYIMKNNVSIESLNYHDYMLENYMYLYDKIFYIPIEFKVEDDGVRNVDEQYREHIDHIIFTYLVKNNIKYIKITGSVEERIEQIINNL